MIQIKYQTEIRQFHACFAAVYWENCAGYSLMKWHMGEVYIRDTESQVETTPAMVMRNFFWDDFLDHDPLCKKEQAHMGGWGAPADGWLGKEGGEEKNSLFEGIS